MHLTRPRASRVANHYFLWWTTITSAPRISNLHLDDASTGVLGMIADTHSYPVIKLAYDFNLSRSLVLYDLFIELDFQRRLGDVEIQLKSKSRES